MQIDPNAVTGVHAAKKDEIKPPFFKKKHTCKDLICFMKGLYPNPRGLSISEAHQNASTALKGRQRVPSRHLSETPLRSGLYHAGLPAVILGADRILVRRIDTIEPQSVERVRLCRRHLFLYPKPHSQVIFGCYQRVAGMM